VEHKEALQTCAVVGQLANAVQTQVNNLLPDGIMPPSIVIFFFFFRFVQSLQQCKIQTSISDFDQSGLRPMLSGVRFRERGWVN
jgi:hypothetical protein